jgi:hypothetical protein
MVESFNDYNQQGSLSPWLLFPPKNWDRPLTIYTGI